MLKSWQLYATIAAIVMSFSFGVAVENWRGKASDLKDLRADLSASIAKIDNVAAAADKSAKAQADLDLKIKAGANAIRKYVAANDTCRFSDADVSLLKSTNPTAGKN